MALLGSGVVALGHVLIDCVGRVSGEVLNILDHLSSPAHVDAALMEKITEALDANAQEPPLSRRAGGGAAVTAKACSSQGLPAVLLGCVGRDAGARFLLKELDLPGVELRFFESDKPTGRFCCFDTPKGRKIVASPQAARDIRRYSIPEDCLKQGWVLHIDGLLIDEPEWLRGIAERAKAAGMAVSMDVSTSFNAAKSMAELLAFARQYCDLVFANEEEWERLIHGVELEHSAARSCVWVIKKAERGASALKNGEWTHKVAVEKLRISDDIGAGDAFAAGFLATWLAGEAIAFCLARGNESAALLLSQRRLKEMEAL